MDFALSTDHRVKIKFKKKDSLSKEIYCLSKLSEKQPVKTSVSEKIIKNKQTKNWKNNNKHKINKNK